MTGRRLVLAVTGSLVFLAAALLLLWSVVATSTARLNATTSGSGSFIAGTVDLAQPESAVALLFDADGLYPGLVIPSCVTVAYEGSVPASVRLHASQTGGTGLEEFVELRLWVRREGSCSATPTVRTSAVTSENLTAEAATGDPRTAEAVTGETPAPSDATTDEGGSAEAATATGQVVEPELPVEPGLTPAPDAPDLVFRGVLGDLWRRHPDYLAGLLLIDRAESGDRLVLEAEVELLDDDDAQGLTTEFSIIIEARP